MTLQELQEFREADRRRLASLPPEVAQAEVDAVLHPSQWHVVDESQLAWTEVLPSDDWLDEDLPRDDG